jgi:hypothetical protein
LVVGYSINMTKNATNFDKKKVDWQAVRKNDGNMVSMVATVTYSH